MSSFLQLFLFTIFFSKSYPWPWDPSQLSPQTAVGTASHVLLMPTLSANSGGEEEVSF